MLLTLNIDDISISLRVIEQNEKPDMKSLQYPRFDQKCRPGNKTQLVWVNGDAGYWVTEPTSSIRLQFSLQLNIYIDKGWLQGISQNFYCNYPKNSLPWHSVYPYRIYHNYSMRASWIWSDKITNERIVRVGYNHFISNNGEWNNCFSKFLTGFCRRFLFPQFYKAEHF